MLRTVAVLAGAAVVACSAVSCARPGTVASKSSVLPSVASASSAVSSVPVVVKPSQPADSAAQDVGDLEQFVQVSATTWWATVVGNLSDQLFVMRTVDAGQHWQDVTPSTGELHANDGAPSYVFSADVAWLVADAEPTTPRLFRTLDGGQSWEQMGAIRDGCTLQFADPQHGWCWQLSGSMGSAAVFLYRSEDGGATWRLISQTTGDGGPSTPDALPFGCGKSLTFTSSNVGWASSFCNGGQPYLETSTDGGARWHPVTPVPLPVVDGGAGLTLPVADGANLAVANRGGLGPGASGISTSSDDGRSWRNHLLPAPPTNQYWNIDLIDPTHWRATDGDVIMATDDAGAHWRRWTPSVSMHDQFGTLTLDFISPDIGSASEPVANGPLWTTVDGGLTWASVTIVAGPYVLS